MTTLEIPKGVIALRCDTPGCDAEATTGDMVLMPHDPKRLNRTRWAMLCSRCGSLANRYAFNRGGCAVPQELLTEQLSGKTGE